MILRKKEIKEIARVGTLYTTGGGIALRGQLKSFDTLADTDFIEIKDAEEFDPNGYVVRIGGIGPSTDDAESAHDIKKMIEVLEKISDKKIVGIYPPEIGQEAFVISGAISAGLPLINFDPSGLRAKPCVDISVFELLKMDYSLSPMVIATSDGEIISVHDKLSSERCEKIMRNTTSISSSGSIFHVSGLVKVDDLIKKKIVNHPYTILKEVTKMNFDEFLKHEPVKEVFNAKITKHWEGELKGFNIDNFELMANDKIYRLIFQNEAMFLLDDKSNIVYSVPDRICLINADKMEGVWVGDLKENMEFKIVVLEPEKIWRENIDRANEIFGRERFKKLIKPPPKNE